MSNLRGKKKKIQNQSYKKNNFAMMMQEINEKHK